MNRILAGFFLTIFIYTPVYSQGKENNKNGKVDGIILSDEPAVILDEKKITLSQAIRMAIEQNHDIISGKYDVAMAYSDYERYQKKYSPFLSFEGSTKYEEYPEDMGPLAGIDKKSLNASAALAKMFSTGTTVSAGVMHEYAKSTFATIPGFGSMDAFSDPEYHRPILFVGIQQELLKNAFGYSERRQEEIFRNRGLMQKENLVSALSFLVIKVIADYWDLVLKKTSQKHAMLQLEETRSVRKIISENVRIGLSEGFELNYYNVLVAAAESAKKNSDQEYSDSLRSFLQTVNLGEGLKIEDSAVLVNTLPEINEEKAIETAYKNRADYKSALLNLENAKLELEMFKNDALPSLTVGVNIAAMGQRDTAPDAYADSSSMKYPSYEAEVKMSYPIDDRAQKVNERNAGYRLKQMQVNLEKIKRSVKDDVITKIEHIETFYEIYQKAKTARSESEAYYNRIVASLKRGRFNAALVKNALDAQVQTRERELGILIRYNIALLELNVAKNDLFEKYQIDIEKYIPED